MSFFFTLSGFLITYLLLQERQCTGTVDVARFYLRRVCRIWPLYFAVTGFGLVFYRWILPRTGISRTVPYEISTAVAMYSLFLPNLMNSLYRMGGILNPLWSIGVEEQFYLAWAPLARKVRDRLPTMCWVVVGVFLSLSLLTATHAFGAGWASRFLGQLKFHFMAVGALWAWAVHRHRDRLLELPLFRSRLVQLTLAALVAEHYLVGQLARSDSVAEVLQLALYGWLIVDVGVNPRTLVRIGNPAFEYLGKVSYGIYLLHMPVVYATAELFRLTAWWHGHLAAYFVGYYAIALGGTIAVAALSYRYFEQPFLRLKDRLGRVPPVAGADAVPARVVSVDVTQ